MTDSFSDSNFSNLSFNIDSSFNTDSSFNNDSSLNTDSSWGTDTSLDTGITPIYSNLSYDNLGVDTGDFESSFTDNHTFTDNSAIPNNFQNNDFSGTDLGISQNHNVILNHDIGNSQSSIPHNTLIAYAPDVPNNSVSPTNLLGDNNGIFSSGTSSVPLSNYNVSSDLFNGNTLVANNHVSEAPIRETAPLQFVRVDDNTVAELNDEGNVEHLYNETPDGSYVLDRVDINGIGFNVEDIPPGQIPQEVARELPKRSIEMIEPTTR